MKHFIKLLSVLFSLVILGSSSAYAACIVDGTSYNLKVELGSVNAPAVQAALSHGLVLKMTANKWRFRIQVRSYNSKYGILIMRQLKDISTWKPAHKSLCRQWSEMRVFYLRYQKLGYSRSTDCNRYYHASCFESRHQYLGY